MHSWYGKLHLKKSGQAAGKLTDREKYVMAKCSFLEGEILLARMPKAFSTTRLALDSL